MTLIYDIYPRIMTKVNVSATVGMSVTVGGNVRNSGEIEYALKKKLMYELLLRIHGLTCQKPFEIGL